LSGLLPIRGGASLAQKMLCPGQNLGSAATGPGAEFGATAHDSTGPILSHDAKQPDPLPPLASLIAGHPFLKGLPSRHLQILADCAMLTEFAPKQLIFREGEVANRFYLIREGKVALETPIKDHGPLHLQTVGGGEVLGWSWLFPPYYWHFDARALEPVKAIFFYGTRLRECCEADHELGYELMQRVAEVVVQRLQATRRQLLTVYGRP
jgi:CRP-like cAMP-binding protein